jgi:hypothetical protein
VKEIVNKRKKQRREMTQTLYARMNKRKKRKKQYMEREKILINHI